MRPQKNVYLDIESKFLRLIMFQIVWDPNFMFMKFCFWISLTFKIEMNVNIELQSLPLNAKRRLL